MINITELQNNFFKARPNYFKELELELNAIDLKRKERLNKTIEDIVDKLKAASVEGKNEVDILLGGDADLKQEIKERIESIGLIFEDIMRTESVDLGYWSSSFEIRGYKVSFPLL